MEHSGFLTYDSKTGLIVKTKSEILQDLLQICKDAYGDSYEVDEGTEMYNFLDIIASTLTDMGNSTQSVYNAFSFIGAEGAPLDSLCSLAGVVRYEGESDSQLRARYYRFLYSKSVGTLKGLEAQLFNYSTIKKDDENKDITIYPIHDVKVFENVSGATMGPTESTKTTDIAKAYINSNYYTIQNHYILVILRFIDDFITVTSQTVPELDYKNINKLIEDYKSLGCGLTLNIDNSNYYFAISNKVDFKITVKLLFSDAQSEHDYGYSVVQNVRSNILEYLNNLKLGEDILYTAIVSCVYKAYQSLGISEYVFSLAAGDDSISYTSGSNGASIGSGNLTQTTSKIIVPYTSYINITEQESESQIVVETSNSGE